MHSDPTLDENNQSNAVSTGETLPSAAAPGVADPLVSDTAGTTLPPVIGRDTPQTTLDETIARSPYAVNFLSGPHGTGKTLLLHHALTALPPDVTTCYLSCREYDTEYAILRQIHQALTGDDPGTGYRTAEMERRVARAIADADTAPVVACDDLGFLLHSDGLSLLYFLSRIEEPLRLILASATLPDPQIALGDRTYSSLHSRHIHLEPYTVPETVDILQQRTAQATESGLTGEQAREIATTTTNLRVGLHWIACVRDASPDDGIPASQFRNLQQDAVNRYRRECLSLFSRHHQLLLAAVRTVVATTPQAYTGDVYKYYQQLCQFHSEQALTPRRTSTLLDHLELLNLIDVTYHRGGNTGKTRSITLVSIEEL